MTAAGNSRFAVTCGLMRQYMREHNQQPPQQLMGGLSGALGRLLSIAPEASTEETDSRTMELFPTRAGASPLPSQERMEELGGKAPLTILYMGRMIVFDDFPAEKAKELIQLAGSRSSPATRNGRPLAVREEPAGEKPAPVPSDMPIARKASVKRFLEKRKHRITATDPYCNKSTALEKGAAGACETAAKDEPAASWLAL